MFHIYENSTLALDEVRENEY